LKSCEFGLVRKPLIGSICVLNFELIGLIDPEILRIMFRVLNYISYENKMIFVKLILTQSPF